MNTKTEEKPLALSVRLCSDKAAFEARVLRRVVFNMEEAKRNLEDASSYKMVVYTPHLLVVRCGGVEVTLSKDGRMLIKQVKDENEARLVAGKVWEIILKHRVS